MRLRRPGDLVGEPEAPAPLLEGEQQGHPHLSLPALCSPCPALTLTCPVGIMYPGWEGGS